MLFRCLILLVSIFMSACSIAKEQPIEHHQQSKQLLTMSEDIKLLLIREMLAVEEGMQALLSSIAKGQWHTSAEIAKKIQSSYILKQSLTAEQKAHLHHSLPEQFIKLDHSFHEYAGMLAHAAEAKNPDVVNFYFYKMTDSCVQCHSRYAREKFPGFTTATDKH